VIAGPALHGRAEIARGFDALLARFANARVAIGRQWTGRDAAVIELVFTAVRAGKPIGVVAGMVPDFAIVARPVHFAAGDDVITESIEHLTFRGRAVTLHGLAIKNFEHSRVRREWQYANSAASLGALFGIAFEVP